MKALFSTTCGECSRPNAKRYRVTVRGESYEATLCGYHSRNRWSMNGKNAYYEEVRDE